jgi:chromosome partitioning protein
VVVLNACPPRAREVDEAREVIGALRLPLWEGQVGDRTTFRRAVASGLTVVEAEPSGKAAGEIRALWAHVAGLLDEHARSPKASARA